MLALKDIQPPVTIEWAWRRGSIPRRATIVEKRGRNLRTAENDWLWWPTINRYRDVRIVAEASKAGERAANGSEGD